MKYFYDTEFLEHGPEHPIRFISIGVVAEDGREFYAVNGELDLRGVLAYPWLADNVLRHLPVKLMHEPYFDESGETLYRIRPRWDEQHRDHEHVMSRRTIAQELQAFLTADGQRAQLWAWYAAYDHVVLAQLFGTMAEMPDGVPWWTNDLKQEVERLGRRVPTQKGGEHHALADARWLAQAYASIYPAEQEG